MAPCLAANIANTPASVAPQVVLRNEANFRAAVTRCPAAVPAVATACSCLRQRPPSDCVVNERWTVEQGLLTTDGHRSTLIELTMGSGPGISEATSASMWIEGVYTTQRCCPYRQRNISTQNSGQTTYAAYTDDVTAMSISAIKSPPRWRRKKPRLFWHRFSCAHFSPGYPVIELLCGCYSSDTSTERY